MREEAEPTRRRWPCWKEVLLEKLQQCVLTGRVPSIQTHVIPDEMAAVCGTDAQTPEDTKHPDDDL
jgi:hypothetical protein